MKTKNVSLEYAENLMSIYEEKGGEVIEVNEGVLGLGLIILCDRREEKKLKEFVIEESYINSWSSGHILKEYTEGLPKEYIDMLIQ